MNGEFDFVLILQNNFVNITSIQTYIKYVKINYALLKLILTPPNPW